MRRYLMFIALAFPIASFAQSPLLSGEAKDVN